MLETLQLARPVAGTHPGLLLRRAGCWRSRRRRCRPRRPPIPRLASLRHASIPGRGPRTRPDAVPAHLAGIPDEAAAGRRQRLRSTRSAQVFRDGEAGRHAQSGIHPARMVPGRLRPPPADGRRWTTLVRSCDRRRHCASPPVSGSSYREALPAPHRSRSAYAPMPLNSPMRRRRHGIHIAGGHAQPPRRRHLARPAAHPHHRTASRAAAG
ncbi:MAG: hypothetical protein MZW92_51090 [Comamonadaceae bacterium]|nr:hypothetical protein [Comamonadaceae bacterium]